ncbi:heavy metal-transporting ATPase [Companilactobacillus tucceti DSM 20183]|uniref:Cd(2+)-exporting ATPase n=2 Tax=Companilactobacillus tucceti TaxID=238012 RepID=A0A0R1J9I7_9LACO|nr:heavy metal translocating P-type ATPase [Companilactobacillus tucceti]KRK64666.1 heavy metal-transporting ATPase [Companilactobacillus tucceti DSM 20183]
MKLYKVESDYQTNKKNHRVKNVLTKESKMTITKLVLSAIFLILATNDSFADSVSIGLYLIAFAIIGGEIVLNAVKNLFKGQVFDENFLMSIATIGALIIGQYPEAVAVMYFYKVGDLFEDIAVNRSKRSISALLSVKPEFATIKDGSKTLVVRPEQVKVGQTILIKPGEKIPLDGKVVLGQSSVDTSALTGESMPREITIGDDALSGSINQGGVLQVKVTKVYNDSTVAKILDLVQNSSKRKANTEKFITRFAKVYTPIVVAMAVFLALVPPLLFNGEWNDWVYRALVFLVISCPCALVISVPLSFFGGIGAASKQGILVKGSNYLESLNKVNTIAFDKTGTLTKGQFSVTSVNPKSISKDELLEIAAAIESNSNHPIAQSIVTAFGKEIKSSVSDYKEKAGYGVSATIDGQSVIAGNFKTMKANGIDVVESDGVGTIVYISRNNEYLGNIVIADSPKSDSKAAIASLRKRGIKTVMLTGDNKAIGEDIALKLGLDKVYTDLLPEDKVDIVNDLMSETDNKVAFVGDGINDTPVLTQADLGIAMGGLGSDAAVDASDMVIMSDEPSKIAKAMDIAKKTREIVVENITLALVIKILFLLLGAVGIVGMWQAVFADVGVTIIAVLNAVRLQLKKF